MSRFPCPGTGHIGRGVFPALVKHVIPIGTKCPYSQFQGDAIPSQITGRCSEPFIPRPHLGKLGRTNEDGGTNKWVTEQTKTRHVLKTLKKNPDIEPHKLNYRYGTETNERHQEPVKDGALSLIDR